MGGFPTKYLYLPISLILCGLLLASTYLCANSFTRYSNLRAKLEATRRQLTAFKELRKEQEKAKRLLGRVSDFSKKVKSLGLTEKNWSRYEVEIQEKVSFPELRAILEQTVSKSNYYFTPIFLYVANSAPAGQGPVEQPVKQDNTTVNSTEEQKKGDVYLRLKGYFLVRQ